MDSRVTTCVLGVVARARQLSSDLIAARNLPRAGAAIMMSKLAKLRNIGCQRLSRAEVPDPPSDRASIRTSATAASARLRIGELGTAHAARREADGSAESQSRRGASARSREAVRRRSAPDRSKADHHGPGPVGEAPSWSDRDRGHPSVDAGSPTCWSCRPSDKLACSQRPSASTIEWCATRWPGPGHVPSRSPRRWRGWVVTERTGGAGVGTAGAEATAARVADRPGGG